MRRFGFFVLLMFAVFIVATSASVVAQSTPTTTPPKGAPVVVTNSVTNPVPVTGTVTSTVSGNINANIINTPSVTPSNTSTTPLFVRDVNNPIKEPFYRTLCFSGSSAPFACTLQPSFTVPTTTADGKMVERLVIEFVTGQCNSVSNAQVPFVVLTEGLYDPEATTFISNVFPFSAPVVSAFSPQQLQAFAQQTTIYATPGKGIWLSIAPGGTAEGSVCSVHINGHLIAKN